MNLQESVADALIEAFDRLGGKAGHAVRSARRFDTVAGWVRNQSTQVTLSGAGGMALPGLYGLTMAAGTSFLLHKMAYCAWGVGALLGCRVLGKTDLINVLMLWVEPGIPLAALEHRAISADLFASVMSDAATRAQLAAAIESLEAIPKPTQAQRSDLQTLRVLREAAQSAGARIDTKGHSTILKRQVGRKLAIGAAANLVANAPLRFVVGLIPFAGILMGAFANSQMMRSIAQAAETYYGHPLTEVLLDESTREGK